VCYLHLQDVPDADVTGHLAADPLQGPHIVAFVDDGNLHALFVVGDTVHCVVDKKCGILSALTTVLAMYYLFDLDYSRQYSMLLAGLQTHVMEEPYKKTLQKATKHSLKR
jgi:hypothetical protein